MAAGPQRAAEPRHLDARIVPVERALIARAEKLEDSSSKTDGGNMLYMFVAAEFRSLAAELHHW